MTGRRRMVNVAGGYEALEAWRSAGDVALCYFIAKGRETHSPPDRADRRARMEPGESLDGLGEARVAELLASGASLTATERRFEAPGGVPWLAQSIGPVWAEGVASGLTGVLFTDLTGAEPRRRTVSGPIADVSSEDLIRLWTEAGSREEGE